MRAPAWLECAALFPGGALLLHFCCRWSELFAAVRVESLPDGNVALTVADCPLSPEGTAALRSLCARRVPARADSLLPFLCRAVETDSRALWPPLAKPAAGLLAAGAQRIRLEESLVSAVRALGETAGGGCGGGVRAALDGLGATLSLLVAALHNVRAPLVCRPLPPWVMEGFFGRSMSGSGAAGVLGAYEGGSHAHLAGADAAALDRAVAGVPPVAVLAAAWPAVVGELCGDALLLLYWLAALAPARLVRAPAPRLAGAAATFAVVHGPPPPPPCAAAAPLWDAHAASVHPPWGATGVRCFHGTATDNAYSVLHFGLRALSGTRHETSGSIFGAGVYLSCSPQVAREFAVRTGRAWAGFLPEAGRAPAAGAAEAARARSAANSTVPTTLRAVFEVDVLRDPTVRYVVGGKDVVTPPAAAQPPPGAYIVVPEANKLWAVALHLFSDSEGAAEGDGGGDGGGGGGGDGGGGGGGGGNSAVPPQTTPQALPQAMPQAAQPPPSPHQKGSCTCLSRALVVCTFLLFVAYAAARFHVRDKLFAPSSAPSGADQGAEF